MKTLLAVINAFVGAFKVTILNKRLYKKLLIYGCIICGMKYDGNNKDVPLDKWKPNDCWPDELPSMLYLDKITDEMNAQNDAIEQTLGIMYWNREDVRALMLMFEKLHVKYCQATGRSLSLIETYAILHNSLKIPFWKYFKLLLPAS